MADLSNARVDGARLWDSLGVCGDWTGGGAADAPGRAGEFSGLNLGLASRTPFCRVGWAARSRLGALFPPGTAAAGVWGA